MRRFQAGHLRLAAIALLFSAIMSGSVSAQGGNRGTVKIHDGADEPSPVMQTEPQVCDFHIHAFKFHPDQVLGFSIVGHGGPNVAGSSTFSSSATTDSNGEARNPAAGSITLADGNYELTVDTGRGGEGRQNKHQVFIVDCPTEEEAAAAEQQQREEAAAAEAAAAGAAAEAGSGDLLNSATAGTASGGLPLRLVMLLGALLLLTLGGLLLAAPRRRSAVDRQSPGMQQRGSAWPRRALAGLLLAGAAALTLGALNWAAPYPSDPAPPVVIQLGTARPAQETAAGPTRARQTAAPLATTPAATGSPLPDATAPVSPGPVSSVATRLVLRFLGVDLPVVSDRVTLPGNPEGYPLCDVAHYASFFGQPGEPGAIYLYAHAQAGMLLPMLEASLNNDGQAMLGERVRVYTSDGRVHVYEIFIVKRHATDWSLAEEIGPTEERLVIQTSEGPSGTPEKLQIAARPVDVRNVTLQRALPSPAPRACPP